MPGPVPSPTSTPYSSAALGKLDSAVPARTALFAHIDLPAQLSLGALMNWLSSRMRDSDTAIRSKMADVNARKVQQGALNELIEALRSSRLKNADAGDGRLQLEPPLDDAEKIRGTDFYTTLLPEDRVAVDALLSKINPPVWEAWVKDPSSGKMVKMTFSEDAAKKGGLVDGVDGTKRVPASLSKDGFEDAIQSLGELSKDLGSRDEMQMIELQSAIAARGQLLQMVSNMIASFNSTADKIVGNVR